MAVSGNLPKFVYFDLGNVLCSFSNERACRQMAEVAGVSPEAVEEFFCRRRSHESAGAR